MVLSLPVDNDIRLALLAPGTPLLFSIAALRTDVGPQTPASRVICPHQRPWRNSGANSYPLSRGEAGATPAGCLPFLLHARHFGRGSEELRIAAGYGDNIVYRHPQSAEHPVNVVRHDL